MIAYLTVLYERTHSDSITSNHDNNYSMLCSILILILWVYKLNYQCLLEDEEYEDFFPSS